jgi:undecaprenyl-diphosphatase
VAGGDAIDRFDARFDRRVDALRGDPILDRLFYTASFFADHGVLWVALGVVRFFTAVGGAEAAHFAGIRAVCAEFGQSVFVNVGVKSLFRRNRPVIQEPRPFYLRTPRTTSFPSGHATASFTAAVLLSQGTPWGWFLFPLAVIVSFSRVYVRIHHASDVIGGVVLGLIIGVTVAQLAPLP